MQATFVATESVCPDDRAIRAALVFALSDGKFVLADIAGRGWCIPGGRLEAGETPEEAVRREAVEEIGATLGPLHPLGYFVITTLETGAAQAVPTYVAEVTEMQPLPAGTESGGVRLAVMEELPGVYYTWDALLEAVFLLAMRA
jgi:8-oxo-dGTP diphosphatase